MSTNDTATFSRSNAKLFVAPVDHFVGSRFSRRAWRAYVALKADEEQQSGCAHDHGHRTIKAAKKCALAMWRKLPE